MEQTIFRHLETSQTSPPLVTLISSEKHDCWVTSKFKKG